MAVNSALAQLDIGVVESGKTELIDCWADQDEFEFYRNLFSVLNKLNIPRKHYWTMIDRNRVTHEVRFTHTNMIF